MKDEKRAAIIARVRAAAAFPDDLSLFAQSTGDIQVLLDEVQKFEAWSGLKVNPDKT